MKRQLLFLQCRDWNEQMRRIVLYAVDEVHMHKTIQADVAFHEGLQKQLLPFIFVYIKNIDIIDNR